MEAAGFDAPSPVTSLPAAPPAAPGLPDSGDVVGSTAEREEGKAAEPGSAARPDGEALPADFLSHAYIGSTSSAQYAWVGFASGAEYVSGPQDRRWVEPAR